jgi:hypothetical protein
MKHGLSLMLIMTMIQMYGHADMYLLCKSMHMAGLVQSTSANSLTQATRNLCPSLEIIRGPAERSRIMRQQLKAQEDMSLETFIAAFIAFVGTKTKKKENIVHGPDGFLGAPLYIHV